MPRPGRAHPSWPARIGRFRALAPIVLGARPARAFSFELRPSFAGEAGLLGACLPYSDTLLGAGADRSGRRRRSFRALAPIVLVLVVVVHGSERIAVAAEASAPIRLQPGRVISRSMAPADHHEFVLDLRAGDVAVVTVRQLGIDVVLAVADPDGRE